MKFKWWTLLFAAAPYAALLMTLQSCGGDGGPAGGGGGGTSFSAEFVALMSDEQKKAAAIGSEACAKCHGGKEDDPVYRTWHETKHASVNVGCESCHGPGSAHETMPTKANIVNAPRTTNPVVCGQCHGPIVEQWQYSKHSKIVTDPIEEAIHNPDRYGRTSRCMACHSGVFRSQVVDAGVDIPNMTDEEVIKVAEDTLSVSPHSANCVTCHDPHMNTKNLTDTGKEVQLRHQVFNTDTTQVGPGKTAAEFTTFNHICAQCHNGRGANPADSALDRGTSRPNMHDSNQFNMLMGFGGVEGSGPVDRNTAHATAPGQCSKCHMPDSRHSFTVSFDKGCNPCHTPADAAARLTSVKDEVQNGLFSLRTRLEAFAKKEFGDIDLWDYTSLITAEGKTPPDQALVPMEVKRARHNYYFVVRSGDYGAHNAPYAKHLIRIANDNLDAINVAKPSLGKVRRDLIERVLTNDKVRAHRADVTAGN